MLFYKGELLHITVSLVSISLAFSLATLTSFPLWLLTVGAGFVLHELAHKAVAQRFGAVAYYKAWMEGLAFAFILAIATAGRFVFAAPGAVYIHKKNLTRFEDGVISSAGVVMNLVLAGVFLWMAHSPSLAMLGTFGFKANTFLAFFNMIPIPPIDGSKVFSWNPIAWAVLFFGAAYLTFFFPVAV